MNFAMQHWVAVILFLLVGFYIGRKTTWLNTVPVIGS
jgi:uncharacterized protein YneF (UPF0154 family)